MNDNSRCLECGGVLENVTECREYLNEMITWDFEDFKGVGKIHHLTVLSYNLQHPSVYSPEGLENAKQSLLEFVRNPTAYAKHGATDLQNLSSDVRSWKIVGAPHNHGSYTPQPEWTLTASDVVKGGLSEYVANVQKWSESVLKALADSGNIG